MRSPTLNGGHCHPETAHEGRKIWSRVGGQEVGEGTGVDGGTPPLSRQGLKTLEVLDATVFIDQVLVRGYGGGPTVGFARDMPNGKVGRSVLAVLWEPSQ